MLASFEGKYVFLTPGMNFSRLGMVFTLSFSIAVVIKHAFHKEY